MFTIAEDETVSYGTPVPIPGAVSIGLDANGEPSNFYADGYTSEEWLDGFNTFSIYQVLPQLIELLGLNVQTDISAKKTSSNRSPDDNTFVFASLCTAGY